MSGLRSELESLSRYINRLRQNRLLGEAAFVAFARDRGIPVSGVTSGDPGEFHRRGWLVADGVDAEGRPLFHPFRVYPLHVVLARCAPRIGASMWLRPDRMLQLVKDLQPGTLAAAQQIANVAKVSNHIVDLAILLEPLYWPRITRRISHTVEL